MHRDGFTWNPQLRHLETDHSRPPVTDVEMTNKLEFFITHLKRDVVHRFHCTRKLTETMESKATFHLRPLSAQQTCREDLGPNGGAAGQLRFPADRTGVQAGAIGQGASGAEDQRYAQIAVRHSFVNRGNQCYMNALIQSLTWLIHVSGHDLGTIMGRGADFFQHIQDDIVDLGQVQALPFPAYHPGFQHHCRFNLWWITGIKIRIAQWGLWPRPWRWLCSSCAFPDGEGKLSKPEQRFKSIEWLRFRALQHQGWNVQTFSTDLRRMWYTMV